MIKVVIINVVLTTIKNSKSKTNLKSFEISNPQLILFFEIILFSQILSSHFQK